MVGSTKDIVKRLPDKGLPTSVVLLGFPDYKEQEAENGVNDAVLGDAVQKDIQKTFSEKIPRLEGTKKEVEDIARLAKQYNLKTEVYLAKQASEGAVKKLRSPWVLHIATHGFYASPEKLKVEERKTKRVMTQQLMTPKEENRAFDVPVENPLLRAGLLLAGAEKTLYQDSLRQGSWQKEDGILTAQEAMNLYLDDTELVVLSACETGLGYISQGEGVYGLQRSFQQAGARAVIMSLWKVNDEVTQKLMTAFYTNWLQKKMSKREAFQQAKAQIRKQYPNPFFWGAFVMIGD
jgi:CHAT domain-containing protein